MPRRLLRDRQIVVDDWRYAAEIAAGAEGPPGQPAAIILSFDQWQAEREHFIARGGRLGVVLLPAHKVDDVAADLPHLELIAAHFSGASEGRGYTQARLLRERHAFHGELRAVGSVRTDQLFFMARCGFNSFELPDRDLTPGLAAFSTFSAAYQASNDRGLALKLQHPRAPA
jgi:uncharacterized protein (DUF934 family)